jgi:hypothetical protein
LSYPLFNIGGNQERNSRLRLKLLGLETDLCGTSSQEKDPPNPQVLNIMPEGGLVCFPERIANLVVKEMTGGADNHHLSRELSQGEFIRRRQYGRCS